LLEKIRKKIQNNFYSVYSCYPCEYIKNSKEKKLVIDTSVLKSSIENPLNNLVIKSALLDNCLMLFNYDMFIEYFDILFNSKGSINKPFCDSFLIKLINKGVPILSNTPSCNTLNIKDSYFLDAFNTSKSALNSLGYGGKDIYLVTNSIKDYPKDSQIITPREYIYYY